MALKRSKKGTPQLPVAVRGSKTTVLKFFNYMAGSASGQDESNLTL